MSLKQCRQVELIYEGVDSEDEICITTSAAISIIPRIGEIIWLQGELRESAISKQIPTALLVKNVCYHVTALTGNMESYDGIVIYLGDLK